MPGAIDGSVNSLQQSRFLDSLLNSCYQDSFNMGDEGKGQEGSKKPLRG
jgi:hypothetical protein